MPNPIQPRKREQPLKTFPETKACLSCGQIKALDEFYSNRDWQDQYCKDAWCKSCVEDCKTKQDIKDYFFNNHRKWDESIWQLAIKKAGMYLQKQSMTFNKAPLGQKMAMCNQIAARFIPSIMQLKYLYFDPDQNPNAFETTVGKERQRQSNERIEKEQKAKQKQISKQNRDKIYSVQFNGYFSQRDLQYLNDYYNKLNEDFSFDNESLKDYAKKVCKASLQFDKAQNDYAMGKCALSDVKDAMALFDTLSKSANFAACKRKQKQQTGVTGWAETTYYLETNGYLKTMDKNWQEDWVDKTVNEYRGSIQNLRLDLM